MPDRRLLILSPIPEEAIRALVGQRVAPGELEGVSIVSYTGSGKADLVTAVAGADIIVGDYTGGVVLDEEVLRAARRCVLVQQPAAGFDSIDTAAAAGLGIPVANAGGANASAVAEHTLMLMLACLKKLTLVHEKTMHGEWLQDDDSGLRRVQPLGTDRRHHRAGAHRPGGGQEARPFGVRLVYYSRRPAGAGPGEARWTRPTAPWTSSSPSPT